MLNANAKEPDRHETTVSNTAEAEVNIYTHNSKMILNSILLLSLNGSGRRNLKFWYITQEVMTHSGW